MNNSLKESNGSLERELNKLREELSRGLASYALENICTQIQYESDIQERDTVF